MHERTALTLRLARLQEAAALAVMSRDLVEQGLGWRYTRARVAGLMRDTDTSVLVACDDEDRVHGFAAMRFDEEHAHLLLLCVHTARQRQGTGGQLLEWLVGSARVAGIRLLQLELRADNPGALAFYRRQGFTEVERVPGYYSGRIDAVRMTRGLVEPLRY